MGRARMQPHDLAVQLEPLHADAFGWALHCCRHDRVAAEEVLQVTYLKILQGRARFDGRASLRTWLFAVVRRTAAEQRRRAALRRWVPLPGGDGREPADGRTDPETRAVARAESTRLRAALARLPQRQQQVLHLVFYQDLTVVQAAEVLGIGVGSARTHYARGKTRLRRLLEEGEA